MTPTHENTSSGLEEYAGLMGEVLRAVQRCSIGQGAGNSLSSINCFSFRTNSKSRSDRCSREPIG
eukprot:CAMPEP_0176325192 /NCGR_PEP_ID=MMETSP0121_2-20121125/73280_1 /TAXON_ID=160619 /ORGANISM="Kryptoperidinium foliaceum, Strain CCMP 1326" /LENGTH=64 /DNA_ID=CAMNT_0017667743 /DNA_START=42 /DNA_END=233 /DNA_ORIENTATION=+